MTSSTDDALILDDLDPSAIAVGRGRRTSKVHTLDKVTQQVLDKPPAKHLAAKELAARELARRHFLPFVVRTHPGYIVEWFHEDLAARLERFVRRVENKQSPRLLISVPPRRGKSQQASKAMPAWFLGRNPRGSIIATTHSDDLANDNSRDVLDILKSTAYQTVFPDLQLHKDNKGATGWRTTQGGRYKPAGVGKGISGRGADIFLVDDPHRDKDAYSPAVRDAIWRWYKSSARTRLMPGGGMCVIQTRWVKDDLIGRLIEEEGLIEDGGEWEYICYPEEAIEDEYRLPDGRIVHEPMDGAKLLRRKGECLSPKRYPPESNLEHKRDPVTWAALYQQNPVSGESAMFDEGMFPGYTTLPSDLRRYSTWDLAVGQQDRNDWTVGVVFGVDPENTIYIIDVLRQRIAPDDLVDLMIDTHLEHRTELDGVEKGHIQMSIGPFFETRLVERRVYDMVLTPMPTGNRDKIARARSIQGRMRQGKVLFDRNAAWFDQLRQEMLDFPAGKHDDVVDAMAWVGLLLDEIGRQAPPPPKRRTQSWRDKLKTGARRKKSWLAA